MLIVIACYAGGACCLWFFSAFCGDSFRDILNNSLMNNPIFFVGIAVFPIISVLFIAYLILITWINRATIIQFLAVNRPVANRIFVSVLSGQPEQNPKAKSDPDAS
jgi:hypothetical protein